MSGLEGAMKGQFEGRMISTSRRQPLGRTSSRPVRISPHLARNHSSTANWPKHSRARLDEYPASIGQQKGHKSSCLLSSSLYCLWFDFCVSIGFCNACTCFSAFSSTSNLCKYFVDGKCRSHSFISTMNAVLLTKQADNWYRLFTNNSYKITLFPQCAWVWISFTPPAVVLRYIPCSTAGNGCFVTLSIAGQCF